MSGKNALRDLTKSASGDDRKLFVRMAFVIVIVGEIAAVLLAVDRHDEGRFSVGVIQLFD